MVKEITKRLCSILCTTLFLVGSTMLWNDMNHKNSIVMANAKAANNVVQIVEEGKGISLENAYPVTDSIGRQNDKYQFQLVSNADEDKNVTIKFVMDEELVNSGKKLLPFKNIRYEIYKDGLLFKEACNIKEDGFLFTDKINGVNKYELVMWIDYNSTNEIMGSYFNAKITLI